MILDINTKKNGTRIQADVCIIGTGAAGITLGLELARRGRDVLLLEGGALTPTQQSREIYDIESADLPVSHESRARTFGDTTTAWSGGWKLLDAVDFESREGFPLSGWPLDKETLLPYYERAGKLISDSNDFAPDALTPPVTAFSSDRIRSTVLRLLPQDRVDFGKIFRDELMASRKATILYGANVTRLENDAHHQVTGLRVQTFAGTEYTVTANTYVVACGGIENARLLLVSEVGNQHDQVGRYFMDHPKGTVGKVRLTARGRAGLAANTGWNRGVARQVLGLSFADAYLKRHQLLNSYVQLVPEFTLGARIQQKLHLPMRVLNIRNFMEQAPVAHNRVSLSAKKDCFGNPLAQVMWSISETDKNSLIALHRALQEDFSARGFGEVVSPLLNISGEWPVHTDASHHCGTTRMGTDPATSVVDADCAVHGFDNLFVAGSSVFPTSGNANPTGNIIALTIRLADHLQRKT